MKRMNMRRFLNILVVSTLLLFVQSVTGQEFDVLLKGGHLIDPKNNIDQQMDLGIKDGIVVKVEKGLSVKSASKTIDVSGLYVAPGLIDMHVHVFMGNDLDAYLANGQTSVMPDEFTFRSGVTTVVDAGSSGWRNFPLFKAQTIDRAKTRVLALLNIVGNGMKSRFEEQDLNDMNPTMTAYTISKLYPNILVGIKAAHYWGGFEQVDLAVEAGIKAQVPVMVDFGEHDPPNSIESLFFEHLRPGDMFTHTYSNGPSERETIVDAQGKLKPFVLKAQQRGIIFDLGHGGGAFTWAQAVPATRQGFSVDVISSDLHTQSMNSAMKDLSNVMSKMMALGYSLKDVIEKSTWKPATVINRTDLGHLSVGAVADIAVFSIRKGDFGFLDVRNQKVKGEQKLEAQLTFREGKVVWDLNGTASEDFRE
ncbi:MAG: amidohydrolase/deacetylase family metallohydrolase [Allomuricauda sp.]